MTTAAAPPAGLRVRLDPDVLVRSSGQMLVGGVPPRLVRLTDTGAVVVRRWQHGATVGTSSAARRLARRLLDSGMLVPDPEPDDGAALDVIVPVHGRERPLRRCLAAIREAAPSGSVLVIDDGSPDGAAIERAAVDHGARVVRHCRRRGAAAARNTGLAHSNSPLVAFIDSDVVLERDCLARLAGHFADPGIGMAGARVFAFDLSERAIASYEASYSSLDMGPRPGRVRPGARVPYIPTAAVVVRRDAARVGFDEALDVGEDVDFVWRLGKQGWGIAYDPTARVRHAHRTTAREFVGRRFAYAASIGPLARRHPAALPALRIDLATAAVGLLLVGRPRLAAVAFATTVIRTRRMVNGRSPHPTALAVELAARSCVGGARSTAFAIRRPWWPVVALAATGYARAAVLLAAAHAVAFVEAPKTRPAHVALQVVDDLVAGAGTWWSCLRTRTATPLLPSLRQRMP